MPIGKGAVSTYVIGLLFGFAKGIQKDQEKHGSSYCLWDKRHQPRHKNSTKKKSKKLRRCTNSVPSYLMIRCLNSKAKPLKKKEDIFFFLLNCNYHLIEEVKIGELL